MVTARKRVAPASCRLSRGRLALGAAGEDARRTAAVTAALLSAMKRHKSHGPGPSRLPARPPPGFVFLARRRAVHWFLSLEAARPPEAATLLWRRGGRSSAHPTCQKSSCPRWFAR